MSLYRENIKMVSKLAIVAAGMFAFGYALIPIYKNIDACHFADVLVDGNERITKRKHAGRNNGQLTHHFDIFAVQAHMFAWRRCLTGSQHEHLDQEPQKENQSHRGQDEAQACVTFLLFRGCGHDAIFPS